MNLVYIISTHHYQNIRQILKEEFHMSDRLITALKRNNQISINEKAVPINFPIQIGDILTVCLDFEEDNSNILPTNMNLDILYEDDSLLIINKPAGIPIHPSQLHFDHTLSNGIKFYFDKLGLKRKIRAVNRLDKDTSRNCYFCQKRLYSRMPSTSNENQRV